MKKILLLSLLFLGNIIQAKDIPSFNHILSNVDKSLVFVLREYVTGKQFNIPEAQAIMLTFRDYLLDEYYNIPVKDIEPTIKSWFKENPALYDYANGNNATQAQDDFQDYVDDYYAQPSVKSNFQNQKVDIVDPGQLQTLRNLKKQLAYYMQKNTYVDGFRVTLGLAKHVNQVILVAKCQEAIRVLKNLGIKQTLSNDQIDLLVQLEVTRGSENTFQGLVKKLVAIHEKLLATFK